MIPHTQTILHSHPTLLGNCFQTAIASVLDLPLEKVPHFIQWDEDGIADWWDSCHEWLWWHGYEMDIFDHHIYTNEYYMVSGKSPRGDFHHVAVYKNGKMVHDPHPSRSGLETEEYFEVIRPIR